MSATDPHLGQTIEQQFKLLELTAKSKARLIYRGEELSTGTTVQVVLIPLKCELSQRSTYEKAFLKLAQAVHSVTHPNIVDLHDYGIYDEFAFVVYRPLEGETLRQALNKTGTLSPQATADFVDQIADALTAGHDFRLIHGDLCPENVVFVTSFDGTRQPHIKEFGLSALINFHEKLDGGAAAASVTGRPQYMPPEKISGNELTPASDLYSLAAMVYEMFTGSPPFISDTTGPEAQMDIFMQHVSSPPESMLVQNPALKSEVDAVVLKGLSKNPRDRQEGVIAFSRQLSRAVQMSEHSFSLPPSTEPNFFEQSDDFGHAADIDELPPFEEPEPEIYIPPFEEPPPVRPAAAPPQRPPMATSRPTEIYEIPESEIHVPQPESDVLPPWESGTSDLSRGTLDQLFEQSALEETPEQKKPREKRLTARKPMKVENELPMHSETVRRPSSPKVPLPSIEELSDPLADALNADDYGSDDMRSDDPFKSKWKKQLLLFAPMVGLGALAAVLALWMITGKQKLANSNSSPAETETPAPAATPINVIVPDEPPAEPPVVDEAPPIITESTPVPDSLIEQVKPKPMQPGKIGVVNLERILLTSIAGKKLQDVYAEQYLAAQQQPNKEELLKELRQQNIEVVASLLVKVRQLIRKYGEEEGYALIVPDNLDLATAPYMNEEVTDPVGMLTKSTSKTNLNATIAEIFNREFAE